MDWGNSRQEYGRTAPARRRQAVSRRNDQPLKPRSTRRTSRILIVTLIMALGALLIPNRQEIGRYLNRPVEKVRIAPTLDRVAESEVTSLLAAYMHEGFFDIDVSGVKQTLESHPWIARAEVKRVWPDSLALSIVEELAIARWGEKSLLNQYGEVFTPDHLDGLGALPLLAGAKGSAPRMMEQYQVISQILSPTGLRIEQLNLSDRDSWELVVSGGLRIVAGRTGVREKLKKFVAIYDKRIANDIADIEKVDLRYSNGFTVKKRQTELTDVASR